MKLYHTGTVEIPRPELRRGRKNADFGQGFYLTPDRDFAYRWAQEGAVLNCYELDTDGLKILRLGRTAEWSDAVFRNRRLQDTLEADVVIGPIANDTIFDTLGILSSGYLPPEEALELLRVGPAYIQAAVKTEKALRQLAWLGAERIEGVQTFRERLRREQEEYLAALAARMEELQGQED